MRAQGILRLSQGLTLQQTADEFMVHLNSVEQWRQRWNELGLAGLYEGRHTGRPKKWASQQRQALGELAQSEGGTVVALLRHIGQQPACLQPALSAASSVRNFSINRPFPAFLRHVKRARQAMPRGRCSRQSQGTWTSFFLPSRANSPLRTIAVNS